MSINVDGAVDDLFILTLPYKHADGHPLLVDLYLPQTLQPSLTLERHLPTLVYFHGGGLTVGNRRSWFPSWLKNRLSAAGILFVSADYRLIPPSTGHDILEDIKDLFRFLENGVDQYLQQHCTTLGYPQVHVDPVRIGVAGTSAGGLCAYLAARHAKPAPVVVLALYAMGGNFLTPHYVSVKHEVFFRGREMLDPTTFADFLYPNASLLESTSNSPRMYHPPISPTPGYPANPRMLLARLYLQMGVFLDFYTGRHQPSISEHLRGAMEQGVGDLEAVLKDKLCPPYQQLFPQLDPTMVHPPTIFVHGSADTAVPVSETLFMHDILQKAGVNVTLEVVDEQEHSFDYAEDAETKFGPLFERIVLLMKSRLFS